jgi:hypothetical protein
MNDGRSSNGAGCLVVVGVWLLVALLGESVRRPQPPQIPKWDRPVLPQATEVVYGSSIITFDNQSGQPALVRLIGPTRAEVHVPNGGSNSIHRVAPGHYVIRVRYGTPGQYRYAEGQRFEVQGSATSYSHVTITLHTVPAGNYAMHSSSEAAFAAAAP